MKDQLALYRVGDALFEQMPQMDFVQGSEVASFLERKGRHVDELFFSGGAVGDVVNGIAAIMGAPLHTLTGRNGSNIGPTGPVTFCSFIDGGSLDLMLRALSEARRLIGKDDERSQRLAVLAEQTGAGGRLGSQISEIEQFLARGRGGNGMLISVYTRW